MNNTPQEGKKMTTAKQKQLGLIITILVLILLVVVIIIAMIAGGKSSNTPAVTTDANNPAFTTAKPGDPSTPSNTNGGVVADATGKIVLTEADKFAGTLLVINANNVFEGSTDFTPTQSMSETEIEAAGFKRVAGTLSAADYTVTLRKDALSALKAMIDEFVTVSGASASNFVVLTGYKNTNTSSEYISGYSAYLKINDGGYFDFNYSGKKVTVGESEMTWEAWFKANCAKYGYAYVATGEFRYVGLAHAKYMSDNSLDIKGYTDLIKTKGSAGLTVTDSEGATWVVKYCPASKGTTTLTVGAFAVYTVSGDNGDGFILAVKGK